MNAFTILAVLTTLAAIFSWLNHRYIRLPNTIGLMVLSLSFSLLLVIIDKLYPPAAEPLRRMLFEMEFDRTLLHGMLGAMLFAGALHLNINDLLGKLAEAKDEGQRELLRKQLAAQRERSRQLAAARARARAAALRRAREKRVRSTDDPLGGLGL